MGSCLLIKVKEIFHSCGIVKPNSVLLYFVLDVGDQATWLVCEVRTEIEIFFF